MSIRPRQAVVIFHGIGEQRPLETLFNFTRPLRGSPSIGGIVDEDCAAIYGASFDLAERYDQRRLKATWNHQNYSNDANGVAVKARDACTGFYEFYWAPAYRNTSWRHVRSWMVPLLRRKRSSVASSVLAGVQPAWIHYITLASAALAVPPLIIALFGSRLMIGLTGILSLLALALSASVCTVLAASVMGLLTLIRAVLCVGAAWGFGLFVYAILNRNSPVEAAVSAVGSLATTIGTAVLAGFFLRWLGDAARYLNNSPDNVDETQKIRAEAVDFLRRLHEIKDDGDTGRYRYERIIIVGHSLGSVIAYDAIRNLWAAYNKSFRFEDSSDSAGN